jgi:hypothetical protein
MMSDSDSAPAFQLVSSNNHAAWVVVTSCVFLIFSVVSVVAKILARIHLTKYSVDDTLLLICTVGRRSIYEIVQEC